MSAKQFLMKGELAAVVCIFGLVLGHGPATVASETVAEYNAGAAGDPATAPDPRDLGWNLVTNDHPDHSRGAVSPDGDTGLNAWNITDASSVGGSGPTYYEFTALTQDQVDSAELNGWRCTVRNRMVDDFGLTIAHNFYYGNGSTRYLVWWDLNSDGELTAELEKGTGPREVLVLTPGADGTAEYHTHELIYDPNDGFATYFFNGTPIGTVPGRAVNFTGIRWGTDSTAGQGSANYNLVRFELGPQEAAVLDHPQPMTAEVGDTVVLRARIGGFPNRYQWLKDGEPIPGATSLSHSIDFVRPGDDGDYVLRITNPLGIVDSEPAQLTVLPDTTPPELVTARGSDTFDRVFLRFSEPLAAGAADVSLYQFEGGALTVESATLIDDEFTVELGTSVQEAGVVYTLHIGPVEDLSGNEIAGGQLTVEIQSFVFSRGALKYEFFADLDGTWVEDLEAAEKFINNQPDEVLYLPAFDTTALFASKGNRFGARISGWVIPPRDGLWEFFLAAADSADLYVSSNADPANAFRIAEVLTPTAAFQESGELPTGYAPDVMQAGERYYVEVLYKQGTGANYARVAWRHSEDFHLPAPGLQPISGAYLGTFIDPTGATLEIIEHPQDTLGEENRSATFSALAVGESVLGDAVLYRWQRDGQDIPGAFEPELTASNLSMADDGARFRVVVSVPGQELVSEEATLTVVADAIPPTARVIDVAAVFDRVTLEFSEPVREESAGDEANYTIADGVLEVVAVEVIDGRRVLVHTSPMAGAGVVSLQIANVSDLAGNVIAAGTALEVRTTATVLAAYNAGVAGSPAVAPDPVEQGWTGVVGEVEGIRVGDVSPDGETGLNAWNVTDETSGAGEARYVAELPHDQIRLAQVHGWRFRVRSRMVDGFGAVPAITFFYGDGSTRFLVWVDLNSAGELVVSLEQGTGPLATHILTPGEDGAAEYHTHELIFDPNDGFATYHFNGVPVGAVPGRAVSFSGVRWGSGSTPGQGAMTFNVVSFEMVEPPQAPVAEGLIAAFDGSQTRPGAVDGVEWIDQSGLGNDAVSGSGAANRRPVLVEDAVNGRNALAFDGTGPGHFLVIPGNESTGFEAAVRSYSWSAVVRLKEARGLQMLLRQRTSFHNLNWGSYFWEGSEFETGGQPGFVSHGRTADGTPVEAVAAPWWPGDWLLVSGSIEGETGRIYSRVENLRTGEMSEASQEAFTPLAYGDAVFTWIGSRHGGGDWFNGEMAELLIYNQALPAEAFAENHSYLRGRYYDPLATVQYTLAIRAQPAPATVLAGQSATFSVEAELSPAGPVLQYQWFRNGEPIEGATDPVLTTEPLSLADHGAAYSVEVSAADVMQLSQPALVLVLPPPDQRPAVIPIAIYDAGTEGNPPQAPDPVDQGWTANVSTAEGVSAGDVSPDGDTGLNAWNVTDGSSAGGSLIDYTIVLTPEQQAEAEAKGWRYAMSARFVDNFGSTVRSLNFYCGTGPRRFLVWFGLNAEGDLEANVEQAGVFVLTEGGAGTIDYHLHEMTYDPVTAMATYWFNGTPVVSWPGHTIAFSAVRWGAGSSPGMGSMNYHHVQFGIFDVELPPVLMISKVGADIIVEFEGVLEATETLEDADWQLIASESPFVIGPEDQLPMLFLRARRP